MYSPHVHRGPVVSVLSPPRLNPRRTSRRPATPYSFCRRAPPAVRAWPMLHRCAFPLSRNVVTASPHPPPPSHVPHVRVDAERRHGQHSSWLEPSALHGHGTGVRRRRKPRGASRKGLFRPAMPRSSRCWSGPRQASTSTLKPPKPPLETVGIEPPAPFGWFIGSPWPDVALGWPPG